MTPKLIYAPEYESCVQEIHILKHMDSYLFLMWPKLFNKLHHLMQISTSFMVTLLIPCHHLPDL